MKLSEMFPGETLSKEEFEVIIDAIEFELNEIDYDMGEDPALDDAHKNLRDRGWDMLHPDDHERVVASIVWAYNEYTDRNDTANAQELKSVANKLGIDL